MIPALNPEESERFRTLRERAAIGETLSEAETAELSALEQQWDAEDAVRLNEATERVAARTMILHQENQELRELLGRKHELANRLESMLGELQSEQKRINAEIARLLTPTEAAELAAPLNP